MLFALLLACPKSLPTPDPHADLLVGTWVRPGMGDTYVFVERDGKAEVVSVTAGDGEVFILKDKGWEGRDYAFTFLVPSTDYVVDNTVVAVGEETLSIDWTNQHGSGSVTLERKAP